jgi:predicted O-methyltransferase YrrM
LYGADTVDYINIEKMYRNLRYDSGKLRLIDLGAGSSSGNEQFRKISRVVKFSSVRGKYGRLLSRIVHWLRPSTIIELGTGTGFSTMYMGITGDQCMVYSIEGCPEIADLARRNMQSLGLHNVKIFTGSFNEILPVILHKIKHPLFIFIDGDHRGERLTGYFEAILPYTDDQTVFVLDDIHWSMSMEKAWNNILAKKELSVSIDLFRMGILFMRKDIGKQHFIFRF